VEETDFEIGHICNF